MYNSYKNDGNNNINYMKIAQNRKKVQSVRKNKEEFHASYSIIGYIECVEKLQTGKCGMLKRREVFLL